MRLAFTILVAVLIPNSAYPRNDQDNPPPPATESQEQQPSEIFEFPPNALEAIHPLMPEYPQESQKNGVEGPAVVEIWIGTEGLVLNKPQVVVAPDQAIGESVVKAVSRWVFKKWRPEFPPKADQGREDLVFYFVLKNNKPMVVRYEGELPAGKTFPPFPRSLREKRTFNPEKALEAENQPYLAPRFVGPDIVYGCRTDPATEIIGGRQPDAVPRVVCSYTGTGAWRRIHYQETLPDVCSCGTGEMDDVLHCQRFEPTQGPVLSGGACDAKSLKSKFTQHVIGLSPEGLRLLAQNTVTPPYPEESRVKGATGPVVVEVMIGADGNLQGRPEIVVAPDQATGYAVVEAVRQWTFPSFVGGNPPQPVRTRGDLTFYFVLDKGKALVARSAAELPKLSPV